ncbi:hypothetical protein [Microlunatus flavus]|uniref:Uncharacterized protein n=1 Tax=Microlunatus flavus TaxID=1036181 RepID=A0A1H9A0R7_9ACTN|nr:hypothetical protein [Microlunatus flavus]SEP70269.1 hypothetical protein SAMN05421756_101433 [Microlunatus flavus]
MPLPALLASSARGRRRDAGSATTEYVGALALLVLLVLALVMTMGSAGASLATKVCQVYATATGIGGGSGACGATAPSGPAPAPVAPPFDPKPVKCKVGEHGEKLSVEVTVLVLKLGENAALVQTTYSNGTVSYTATNGGQVGVVVSAPGAEVNAGPGEVGEKVDLGGDLKVDAGSTWNFANQAEADAMRSQLDAYRRDQTLQTASPAYRLWAALHGGKKPPRPPDQSVVTLDLGGYLDAKAGVKLPWQKSGSTVPTPPIPGVGGSAAVQPPQAGLKFGANQKWTMITDSTKQTKTYTTTGEGYGQGNLTVGPLKGELKGLLGSSMSVTRDKDNQVTNVTLVTTTDTKATLSGSSGTSSTPAKGTATAGGNGVHVTTASLDVKDPQQRALVDAWLERQATDPNASVPAATAFPDTLVPGDDFQNLMYTGATVSDVHYANVTDKVGFAAKVKAGVSIGVDLSSETNDSKATSASYLGAPGSGAPTRQPVDFPGCTGQ